MNIELMLFWFLIMVSVVGLGRFMIAVVTIWGYAVGLVKVKTKRDVAVVMAIELHGQAALWPFKWLVVGVVATILVIVGMHNG